MRASRAWIGLGLLIGGAALADEPVQLVAARSVVAHASTVEQYVDKPTTVVTLTEEQRKLLFESFGSRIDEVVFVDTKVPCLFCDNPN